MKTNQKTNIRVLACGGGAINIASIFEQHRGAVEAGAAPVDVSYLDTSTANFTQAMPKEFTMVIPTSNDGSGGLRSENNKSIKEHVPSVLQKHEPGYCTIVLSTASGGSGSVIAPYLTAELLRRDEMVIPIVIGDATQGHWIKNTLATLASYEKISAAQAMALPIGYFENVRGRALSDVDADVVDLIITISILFSRQNEGLDSRDLYNALRFHRITSYQAHAALLCNMSGVLDANNSEGIITAVSALVDKDDTGLEVTLPYAKQGVLPKNISQATINNAPLHLVTKAYPFNDIADRLKEALERMSSEAAARTVCSTVLAGVAGVEDEDDIVI